MILLIDIGNTNTVCALHHKQDYMENKRIESKKNIKDALKRLKSYDITEVAMCSVVPDVTKIFVNEIKNLFQINPFIVSHKNSNIKLKVDTPADVGADRLCNIKAAITKIKGDCIVLDFGTATTYDVINKKQEFIGGAIAPGIDVSANYLIKKAALLKNTILEFPEKIVGKNTKTNIQSGVMYSAIYSIEGMVENINRELNSEPNLILTGGFSSLISPKLSFKHTLEPNLTLEGIRLIYEESK